MGGVSNVVSDGDKGKHSFDEATCLGPTQKAPVIGEVVT